jgi:hypothetical protein
MKNYYDYKAYWSGILMMKERAMVQSWKGEGEKEIAAEERAFRGLTNRIKLR